MATTKKANSKTKKDPCWEGYEMVGMKIKKRQEGAQLRACRRQEKRKIEKGWE